MQSQWRHRLCFGLCRKQRYFMMTNRYALCSFAFALTISIAACSREAVRPSPRNDSPVMAMADSHSEPGGPTIVHPRCADNFAAFDDNGDGRVSLEEFSAHLHDNPNLDGTFRNHDHDGDGSLTVSEFCSGSRSASGPAETSWPGVWSAASMAPRMM